MTNRSKQRGTKMERDLVNWLRTHGWPHAERRALHGTLDKGDVVNGPPGWAVEAKDAQAFELAAWCNEAAVEARNADVPWYVVIFRRRRKPISEAYCLMPLRIWNEVIQDDPPEAWMWRRQLDAAHDEIDRLIGFLINHRIHPENGRAMTRGDG